MIFFSLFVLFLSGVLFGFAATFTGQTAQALGAIGFFIGICTALKIGWDS